MISPPDDNLRRLEVDIQTRKWRAGFASRKRTRREGGDGLERGRALVFVPHLPCAPMIVPRPEAHPRA